MCKPKIPQPPAVVVRDPVKEAADAANQSQARANSEIAAKRVRRRGQSLFTMGAGGASGGGSSGSTLLAMASGAPVTGG